MCVEAFPSHFDYLKSNDHIYKGYEYVTALIHNTTAGVCSVTISWVIESFVQAFSRWWDIFSENNGNLLDNNPIMMKTKTTQRIKGHCDSLWLFQ